jgi:Putative adhesin
VTLLGVAALTTVLSTAACNPSTQNTSGADLSSSSGPESSSADGAHTEQTTYEIAQTVSQLTLDGRSGRVTVTAADGPISVTESFAYSDDKPATSHNVTGDGLALEETGCQHERTINGRCEVDWDIKAPAATIITLSTKAGGIAVTGMSGAVDAKTNAGGIRGRALVGKTVTTTTNAGGVDLKFNQPPDQVQATSNAGGIDIQVPAGNSYAVQAESNTGHPDVDVTQADNSTHKIQARTNAGGIDISNG